MSKDKAKLIERDPFSVEAMKLAKTKLLSSKIDRDDSKKFLKKLNANGYLILEGVIGNSDTKEIKIHCESLMKKASTGATSFGGFQTKRLFNMVARTRKLDHLLLHPTVISIIESYLEDQIQLSVASLIQIGSSQKAQPLHRDDNLYPLERPRKPLTLNAMWALDDFTEKNGSTLLSPGSHLLGDDEKPEKGSVISAVMPAGSLLLYDGSLFHAGGANNTNTSRLGFSVVYSRSWLRQQENQFLGVPPEIAKTLPKNMQKLIGYWVSNNFLGYLNDASPARLLD
ncbi:MAG: hypothetical protein CL568_05010 [Alphaproteobacteria bacterium]|nr:hypothetical protein [Alphaproteobacteria bacterium]PPR13668.1 MAG: hypothetical protein CFH42_01422 [Alphaproteobacteria bacterium MarineAlpha12_Bin1]